MAKFLHYLKQKPTIEMLTVRECVKFMKYYTNETLLRKIRCMDR